MYIYDMRYGVKASLKDQNWRRFEYNRLAGLCVVIGLTWINAFRFSFHFSITLKTLIKFQHRVVMVVTTMQNAEVDAHCLEYDKTANSVFLHPFNSECLTLQGKCFQY